MKWKIIEPMDSAEPIKTGDELLKMFGTKNAFKITVFHPMNARYPVVLEYIPETMGEGE